MAKNKMGRRLKSKLGCVSILFQCFSKKSRAAADAVEDDDDGDDVRSPPPVDGKSTRGKINAPTRQVSINDDCLPRHSLRSEKDPEKFRAGSVRSGKSGRSSVYFDALNESWHSLGGESFDESFVTLQLDGQYYFNALDDQTISKEAFEGINMYPRLPTTTPDRLPDSPISTTNMESLLHSYQHRGDDIQTRLNDDEAYIAAGMAASALERQAKRLMTVDEGKNSIYLVESTNLLLKELKMPSVREKGFPGELTEAELEAVKLFQSELKRRDPIYNEIVRALSSVEKEAYALCRFLRARKFDVEKVFALLDEAKVHYIKARENGFYPDLEQALGVSRSVFLSQYPAVFCGNAKNGCPVLYLRLGLIKPEGVKCLIPLDKADRFFWNDMLFTWTEIIKEGRRNNPESLRTESVLVYDMKGMSRSLVNNDGFDMIKTGNQIMASFPETLHCLMVINVPGWFGVAWSVVKKLIDPRTASKIEVFTNAEAGLKRMGEMIDASQIPSDYNGEGLSLAEAAASAVGGESSSAGRLVVLNKLMNLSKKTPEQSHDFELKDEKQVTLTVFSRCKEGAKATLCRASTGDQVTTIDGVNDCEPYSRTIGTITGPGSFSVRLKANSEPGVFLVLGTTSA